MVNKDRAIKLAKELPVGIDIIEYIMDNIKGITDKDISILVISCKCTKVNIQQVVETFLQIPRMTYREPYDGITNIPMSPTVGDLMQQGKMVKQLIHQLEDYASDKGQRDNLLDYSINVIFKHFTNE